MNDIREMTPPGPAWCIVTGITGTGADDLGTVVRVHSSYDEAIAELEHPDELWPRYDAPAVGDQIARGCGRAVSR